MPPTPTVKKSEPQSHLGGLGLRLSVRMRTCSCVAGLTHSGGRSFHEDSALLQQLHADTCHHQAFKYIAFSSRWEDSTSGSQSSSHVTVFLPHLEDKEDSIFVCLVFKVMKSPHC